MDRTEPNGKKFGDLGPDWTRSPAPGPTKIRKSRTKSDRSSPNLAVSGFRIKSDVKNKSERVIECNKLVNDITNAYECENFEDQPSNQICDQAAQQFFNDLLFTCNQDSCINFPIPRNSDKSFWSENFLVKICFWTILEKLDFSR